jgi:hypothetical protein
MKYLFIVIALLLSSSCATVHMSHQCGQEVTERFTSQEMDYEISAYVCVDLTWKDAPGKPDSDPGFDQQELGGKRL